MRESSNRQESEYNEDIAKKPVGRDRRNKTCSLEFTRVPLVACRMYTFLTSQSATPVDFALISRQNSPYQLHRCGSRFLRASVGKFQPEENAVGGARRWQGSTMNLSSASSPVTVTQVWRANMRSATRHRRNVFTVESLEVRSAPSHVGAPMHALVAVHAIPRVTHVATVVSHPRVERRTIEVRTQDVGSTDSRGLHNETATTDKASPDTTTHDSSGTGSTSFTRSPTRKG